MEPFTVDIDKIFTVRKYSYTKVNRDEEYRKVLSEFLYYVSVIKPIQPLVTIYKAVHGNLFNFIGLILKRISKTSVDGVGVDDSDLGEGNVAADDIDTVTVTSTDDVKNVDLDMFSNNYYEQIRIMFELPELNRENLPWWGHVYWRFLHLSSFYTDRFNLHLQFNCILMTLYLLLPCPTCQKNYQEMQPLKTLCIPIFKTKDATTMMYELHNQVNLHKQPPGQEFEFEQFLQLYNLSVLKSEEYHLQVSVNI